MPWLSNGKPSRGGLSVARTFFSWYFDNTGISENEAGVESAVSWGLKAGTLDIKFTAGISE